MMDLQKAIHVKSVKSFVLLLFFLILLMVIIALYIIMHICPFNSASVIGFFLDVLLVFSVLISGNIIISYLHGRKKKIPVLSVSLFIISVITVVLVYFYKFKGGWKLSEQLTYMEVIIGIVSAIVVIWGGYLALKQIKEAVNTNKIAMQTNKLSSFSNMIEILQGEKGRNDRKIVYGLYDNERNRVKQMSMWSSDEKQAAQDTLANLDQIGLMVKYGLLDYEFLEGWAYSIYKCLYVLKDYTKSKADHYCYRIRGTEQTQSNYCLGVEELIKRKDINIIYDFEEKSQEL